MNIERFELSNGIKVIHRTEKTTVANVCVTIDAGTRDETPNQKGLAHFMEHMLFKGTKKRKAFHIASLLEKNGGELNAFTTKEHTCLYATFLEDDYARAIDLLSDVIVNSVFSDVEIVKEAEIILDEINSYLDTPSEQIFDDFEELIFGQHPLGYNILGEKSSITSLKQNDFSNFRSNFYTPNKIVISSNGPISTKVLKHKLETHFTCLPNNKQNNRTPFNDKYTVNSKTIERNTFQAHCIIGGKGYDLHDEKRNALSLLNNVLGGPSSNSRLNLNIREKRGYTYNIESNFVSYSDGGIQGIYFGADKKNLNKCISLIQKELKKIREERFSTLQLHQAKKQLLGQIAIGRENRESFTIGMGKGILIYDKHHSIEEIKEIIDKISASEILEVANEIYSNNNLSTLIYT